jgi:hypothetical protein
MSSTNIDRSLCLLALAVAGLAFAGPARADDAADPAVTMSIDLFQAGRRLAESGDCRAAIEKFRESIRANDGIGARLNAAVCEVALGSPADAYNDYRVAQDLAEHKEDPRADVARAGAHDLEPRVVRIIVNGSPAYVTVDRKNLDRSERALLSRGYALAPGTSHTIVASSDTRHWRAELEPHEAGLLPALTVSFDAPEAASVAATTAGVSAAAVTNDKPEKPDAWPLQKTLGLVAAGAGAVGLAVGGIVGAVAIGKGNEVHGACSANGGTYPNNCGAAAGSQDAANQSAFTLATVSTASLVAGGVLILGGAALWFSAPTSASPRAAQRTRITASPRLGPGLTGVALEGTF